MATAKPTTPPRKRYSSVRIPMELLRTYRIAAAQVDMTGSALMKQVLCEHAAKLNRAGGHA